jgi:polysaccharide export outer membrane protein
MILFTIIGSPIHALAEDYHLGRGDVITLTILASGKEEQKIDLTVSDSGQINVPLIGFVKAEGQTIQQLEDRIYKPLAADYYVDPQVNIQIKDYNSLHYYISGAVKNPGRYIMSSSATLMELIAKAGGVTEDCGNTGYIVRNAKGSLAKAEDTAHKQQIEVDLRNLLDKGSTSRNIVLEPGDVVYFPSKRTRDVAESKIYIEGEIVKPGVYDFQEGLTALSACITAGGFKQFAAPNRTTIIRQNNDKVEIIKVNLSDVQKGTAPDVVLKSGDRIHVPETWF